MVTLRNNRFLQTTRIKAIVETLASRLEVERPLIWLDRLNLVPAFDDEIMGRFVGTVLAADLIADEQEAVVHDAGKIELYTQEVSNIKHGARVGGKTLQRLHKMENYGIVEEENAFLDWEMRLAENLLFGVRQRMNFLACGMFLDQVDYDRLGYKISGASWGMPAEFKQSASPTWDTPATATPIANIFAIDALARKNYGFTFDHVTMSTDTFNFMVATTEFRDKFSFIAGTGFQLAAGNLNTANQEEMMRIATRLMGKTIELDDATFAERTNAGVKVTRRYLPNNKVILTRKQDHKNSRVWDFANGVVTESLLGENVNGLPEGLATEQRGPVAYWTWPPDLNPAEYTAWAVVRGFPRKHEPTASAVITAGTYT